MWRKGSILAAVLLLLAAAIPATADGTAAFRAEFYNNPFLSGAPVVVRQDNAVAFDWGSSAPAAGVNADNFSVRWTADVFLTAGTYRFYTLADDAMRVTVNGVPVVDTITQPRVGQIISADIALSQATHRIQVDYQEFGGSAYVFLSWVNVLTNPTGPNFPPPQNSTTGVTSGPWTAQYYNNRDLSGLPTLIQTENTPSRDWGAGSPVVSVQPDNFSARWTSVQTLEAGQYRITVRADDGVRVYVNGVLVINEWGLAQDRTFTADLNLPAGQHNFMVEYFEAGGVAFIQYNLTRLSGSIPPTTAPTAAIAVVSGADRLNVRSAASALAPVLTKINRGETYPVVGRNADSTWWQINVNGVVGWSFGRYLTVSGGGSVPVVDSGSAANPAPTGFTATSQVTVNLRSLPSTRAAILGQIPRNTVVSVVGRKADNTWWQVNYAGTVGWVSSRFVSLDAGADLNRIPVTG